MKGHTAEKCNVQLPNNTKNITNKFKPTVKRLEVLDQPIDEDCVENDD